MLNTLSTIEKINIIEWIPYIFLVLVIIILIIYSYIRINYYDIDNLAQQQLALTSK